MHQPMKDISVIGADWPVENAERFAVRAIQDELAMMPEAKRQERLAHVRELLTRERARGQKTPSALAKLAPMAYGIRIEDCR